MTVNIHVRRFAQSDAERTLLRTGDPTQRENLKKAMAEYYAKLKADAQTVTTEDVEKLLRVAFKAYITQTVETLDIFEQYRIFTGKHIYNMHETHPGVATLKHKHAKARQELGDVTAPISNLRTNSDGDIYSWLERQPDGILLPRTVKRVNDGRYEVTIKDDLPATDTEARVERTVEYKVKSEDVNVGKEICDTTYSSSDPFINTLPKCDEGMTSARFQKARTVIHIPAGSAEKMVPATN